MRKYLNTIYLDFFNNYISVEKFAEYNLLDVETATKLLEAGRLVNNQGVDFEHQPEAMTF